MGYSVFLFFVLPISSEHTDTELVPIAFYPAGGQHLVVTLEAIAGADNQCLCWRSAADSKYSHVICLLDVNVHSCHELYTDFTRAMSQRMFSAGIIRLLTGHCGVCCRRQQWGENRFLLCKHEQHDSFLYDASGSLRCTESSLILNAFLLKHTDSSHTHTHGTCGAQGWWWHSRIESYYHWAELLCMNEFQISQGWGWTAYSWTTVWCNAKTSYFQAVIAIKHKTL